MQPRQDSVALEATINAIKAALQAQGVPYEDISGRPKNLYGIYTKLQKDGKPLSHSSLESVYDLMALRVVVPHKHDCYAALRAVQSVYRTMKGRSKDFIRDIKKPNGYQSLHETVYGEGDVPVEVSRLGSGEAGHGHGLSCRIYMRVREGEREFRAGAWPAAADVSRCGFHSRAGPDPHAQDALHRGVWLRGALEVQGGAGRRRRVAREGEWQGLGRLRLFANAACCQARTGRQPARQPAMTCSHAPALPRPAPHAQETQYKRWLTQYKLRVHDQKVRPAGSPPTDGSLSSLGVAYLDQPEEQHARLDPFLRNERFKLQVGSGAKGLGRLSRGR